MEEIGRVLYRRAVKWLGRSQQVQLPVNKLLVEEQLNLQLANGTIMVW